MTDLPDNPRLFVAIELPQDVLDILGRLQHDLQRRGLNGLRWVRPEGIHLTLKFLGETPRAKLPAIAEALSAATIGIPPHRLALGKVGAFGTRNSPRVLWVDLQGDLDTLGRLQQQVETALARLDFPREERRFSPHLTLARVRPESARAVAGPLAQALQDVRPPEAVVPVTAVSLMLSRLDRGGAVYTRLDAFPLTA